MLPPHCPPPHYTEAEEALIGALLVDSSTFDDVSELVDSEDFYHLANSVIFQAVKELSLENTKPDPLLVCNLLRSKGQLVQAGGGERIEILINYTPSAANAKHYARLVRQAALERKLLSASTGIANLVYDRQLEAGDKLERAEELLYSIRDQKSKGQLVQVQGPASVLVLSAAGNRSSETTMGIFPPLVQAATNQRNKEKLPVSNVSCAIPGMLLMC